MARGKGGQSEATPAAEADPQVAHDTGGIGTAVEQQGEQQGSGELPELSREDQQAAVASSMGGSDNYPYVDRTAIPLHERNLSAVNNPLTEASQAELNPAFTAKQEDGGPVVTDPESGEEKGIGTEPNVHEQMLAAAANSGDDDAGKLVQDQIDAGQAQQMDVDEVNAQAQERAPEGVDASTGQKE